MSAGMILWCRVRRRKIKESLGLPRPSVIVHFFVVLDLYSIRERLASEKQ